LIRGLDIFCGAGGSSAGAQAAGVTMVGAIDMSPTATSTYQENFCETRVITKRLEDVALPALKRSLGNIDILLSSPECTNHTCAKGGAPRDEASRATAMYVVQYARVFRPRWFVLENVVHMRPWPRYEELKRDMIDLGYNIAEQILDASNYGVAQTRRRLFLVGDRKREPAVVTRKRVGRRLSAKSILDKPGTWATSPLRQRGRAKGTLVRAKRAIAALGEETPFLLVYYGSDGSGGWQALTRPLRTITTLDRFALVEPNDQGPQMRMLQVPELRRAMGFSENFLLSYGSRRDRIRLLGNCVCPPVMEEVVSTLTRGK
jgi:DNA (cytosine-5)-methyltransferase 1